MTRARTYITVIQAPEGYPADSELRKLEETPAPPVIHAVVLLDDHEKLEAEVERLREALKLARDHLTASQQSAFAEVGSDIAWAGVKQIDKALRSQGENT